MVFKVILFFSAREAAKLKKTMLGVKSPEDAGIILIDARRDNKPSASKA